MSRYLLTEEAKQDLTDIRRYLVCESGVSVAKSTLTKIETPLRFSVACLTPVTFGKI